MDKIKLVNKDEMSKLEPKDFFEIVKSKKVTTTDDVLKQYYNNAERLLQKAMKTNQISACEKLMFHLETIEKEKILLDMGINTFIYQEDIEDYIDNVAKDVVKIIELERYEREIPDEVVDAIEKTKDIFNRFYIVFTDYTGKIEKQVEKERREKDPILFGTFEDAQNRVLINRFYFVADWVDEYCDLTLDKMISEMKSNNKDIKREISTPVDLDTFRKQLKALKKDDDIKFRVDSMELQKKEKKTFFSKIKTFLTKGKQL